MQEQATLVPLPAPSEEKLLLALVGLDVHKHTTAVAVARRAGLGEPLCVQEVGDIRNTAAAVKRLLEHLTKDFGPRLRFLYEAGPCGLGLLRKLRGLGFECEIVAPSLIPQASGERVKTDRRDAVKLTRLGAMGYLTPLRVPSVEQEAIRELVRFRADLHAQVSRQRTRITHFLLRYGHSWTRTKWSGPHRAWLKDLKFDQPAQQTAFRGHLDVLTDLDQRLEDAERDLRREAADWTLALVIASLRALLSLST